MTPIATNHPHFYVFDLPHNSRTAETSLRILYTGGPYAVFDKSQSKMAVIFEVMSPIFKY